MPVEDELLGFILGWHNLQNDSPVHVPGLQFLAHHGWFLGRAIDGAQETVDGRCGESGARDSRKKLVAESPALETNCLTQGVGLVSSRQVSASSTDKGRL